MRETGQRARSSSRDAVAEEVGAEVTLHKVAHVEGVLDDQRLVEVVLGAEFGDITLRAGPLAAAAGGRVAECVDRDKDDEGDTDDDRNHLQQAPNDVLPHASPLSGGRQVSLMPQ